MQDKDRDIYSILIPFVEDYFKGEDYSIDKFPPIKAKSIKENSIILVQYDSKNKVVTLINSQKESETLAINLRTKNIKGAIDYDFDCNTNINYFDNVSEYIFNSELLKNILTYTSVGIRGKIKGVNKFSIYIGTDDSEHLFDNIEQPVFSLFNNELEFSTLFNISRNITITEEDRFVWLFNSAANLKKASNKSFAFKFVAKDLKVTDQMIFAVKNLDNSNIASVDFVNCKVKLQDKGNIEFIKKISSN